MIITMDTQLGVTKSMHLSTLRLYAYNVIKFLLVIKNEVYRVPAIKICDTRYVTGFWKDDPNCTLEVLRSMILRIQVSTAYQG